MIQDAMASFYGGYDQAGYIRRAPTRISGKLVAIAIATIALLAFVAADVAALESPPVVVKVTVVNWNVESFPLTTAGGFAMHPSQSVSLTLTCSSYCYRFSDSASVSAPFKLVSFSVVYAPIQYTNATVQAPSSGYDGPLTITLGLA